jgi:hypothetical protein
VRQPPSHCGGGKTQKPEEYRHDKHRLRVAPRLRSSSR